MISYTEMICVPPKPIANQFTGTESDGFCTVAQLSTIAEEWSCTLIECCSTARVQCMLTRQDPCYGSIRAA